MHLNRCTRNCLTTYDLSEILVSRTVAFPLFCLVYIVIKCTFQNTHVTLPKELVVQLGTYRYFVQFFSNIIYDKEVTSFSIK